MFKKGSRYEKAALFKALPDGTVVFEGIRPRSIGSAKGVIKHTIKAGDRLDLLARHYYNDDKLWWRIVDANPNFYYAGDMTLTEWLALQQEKADPDGKDQSDGQSRSPMEGQSISIPKARE